ncbi:N-acetyltransferase [Macrococcus hajekii]|uniref:Lipid II:glycine glycyltransferase n=1 Tax=Macrococcus hajekii TaxID=198482 RepID=A0A4R6BJI0_9STAP|nr:lipid II:glycine glycyltransferase FemX [Macrococcus hajekii]TDM01863.1 N-acetyltransferase [Macrococcus hajekii]GGB08135.1 lipid II:glycine glycyltransferase [Macrococcus hajekii]
MTVERLTITDKAHDEFVKTHPHGDLLQLSKWGDVKKSAGWYSKRIAVGRAGEVAGVAQLLFKKVPRLPYTLCYISRGFVCDYRDHEVVEALLEQGIEIAKAERAYSIKIDPDVEVTEVEDLVDYMESIGFKHKGFEDGLSKHYIQPRMTMVTNIDQSEEDLIKSFERNNRSRVKLSQKKGTRAYIASRDELQTFADLMQETGSRDGFLTRDVSYFENIYDALNPDGDAELVLVKLVPGEVLPKLREERQVRLDKKARLEGKEKNQKIENQIKDLDIQLAKLEKQIDELTEMEKTTPEGKVLSGSILTFAGHKAYYLYGASSNEYRDYLPNYNMQLTMMRYARDKGAKTYDFGGTSNHPDKESEYYGLWQFKKMWGTKLSAKIGEFDYVLNPPVYQLIEQVKPQIMNLKRKLGRR